VLFRTIERDQQFHCCIGAMLYFHLDHPRTLLAEVGLWKTVPKILGKDSPLDEMVAKSRGEFLVAGKAFSANGQPTSAVPVKVRVGTTEKQLAVIGDRVWKNEVQTSPKPFTEMRIGWAEAFGGEGFLENPVGKGYLKGKPEKDKLIELPNVEYPNKLIRKLSDTPKPAGLMPLDISWSFRQKKSGTYDDKWLKELFPGTPKDIDWTIFNVAPEDQWLKEGFFRGDETFLLENMHPTRNKIEGRLPGAAIRCYVNQREGQSLTFREVGMKIDTVWLFPEQERGIVIYRGVVKVADDEATDVEHLLLGCEDPLKPKSEAHYREVFTKRTDKTREAFEYLKDSDLMPDWPPEPVVDHPDEMAAVHGRGLLRTNLKKKQLRDIIAARAEIASHGLDPDEHGPKLPGEDLSIPPIDQMPEFLEKIQNDAKEQKRIAEEQHAKTIETNRKLFEQNGLDYTVIEKEQTEAVRGPPSFKAQDKIDFLLALQQQGKEAGVSLPDVDSMLADPKFTGMLLEGELAVRQSYRQNAHLQEPVDQKSEEQSEGLKRWITEVYARTSRSLPNIDLTGAILRGVVLPGIDLHDSLMERVDLSGASLAGADLRNVVLAHGKLVGADLKGANLTGANLGKCDLRNCDFRGANLSNSILVNADLTGANLSECILTEADLQDSILTGAVLNKADAKKLTFVKVDLSGMTIAGADLTEVNFIECVLDNTDFSHSILLEAAFITCRGRLKCGNAKMDNVRFVLGTDFSGSDFRGASMLGSGMRDTVLNECDFGGAKLTGSDLTGCKLRKAKFVLANLKETIMIRTDVSEADFTRANLQAALLTRATIEGAQFLEANLFLADMARVKSSPKTSTTGSYLKKVRIYPLRKAQS